MESFQSLISGFDIALSGINILLVLLGAFFGTLIGMLPGIGPVNAIAILFPIMYALGIPADSAIILFAGIFYGSQYGNSISSILLNIPGTSSSAVTAIEGYALTKQQRGGEALAVSAIASFIGGTLSIFLLALFAPMLAVIAIDFGPAQYTVLMVFAFLALAAFTEGSVVKAVISAFLGLAIASIGIDPITGAERFTFGFLELYDGIHFVVVVIGFFAISELLEMLVPQKNTEAKVAEVTSLSLSFRTVTNLLPTSIRSSLSGFIIGVLPGAGATIASFVAYATERKILKKHRFGKGDLNGVAAPEAANNASAVGSFIPLMILGVPGSETTAVMLGSLISLGLNPGPLLMIDSPHVFWGLAASMFIGNFFLIMLNLPLVRFFVLILKSPRWALMPLIALLSVVGVYTASASSFDVVLMLLFGVMGWVMRRTHFPLAPLVLGVVLGSLIEVNFRRALLYSDGSYAVFFQGGISLTLWAICLALLLLPYLWKRYQARLA